MLFPRPQRFRCIHLLGWTLLAMGGNVQQSPGMEFRVVEICDSLKVGYAVCLVDLNQDDRTDIVVVDTERVLWFENPSWQQHVLLEGGTRPDNVCIAPHDINRDGRVDFALGADWGRLDTSAGGTVQWIEHPADPAGTWKVHQIGTEPTVHRMRFADLDGDQIPELVVAPLMGRNTTRPLFAEAGVRLLAYHIPARPSIEAWPQRVLSDELHVVHNFWPTDLDGDGQTELLAVSFEGLSVLSRGTEGTWSARLIGTGNQDTSPNRGASEVKHGRLGDSTDYVATIEPWHGFQVVVYTPGDSEPLWDRRVLDEQLQWGHAVWCTDLDGDRDQELVIGVRDNLDDQIRCGVRIYDPQDAWRTHDRYLIDPGGVAVEDLAAGDLDGDGMADIVAVGRQTGNVRIYFNQR